MDRRAVILGTLAGLMLLIGVYLAVQPTGKPPEVTNFEECTRFYPVMESYPRRCRTPNGRTFVEDVGNELERMDVIRITNPRPNQVIESPLRITGQARGTWYFEASFPAVLLDGTGNQIAMTPVQAQGYWMTEEFVEFRATLTFQQPSTKTGTLILKKDNPSGLPQHDDQLRIPVRFSN